MSDINRAAKKDIISTRPPIVVVLGHVDHGKTTILDKIRETKIAEKESGGITQHIGAYQVTLSDTGLNKKRPKKNDGNYHSKKVITFLDTPGHEAFTAIRSRGAKVADIALLVVAADESVKLQTKEAIKIIQSENIPVIVVINKIDKEGASSQKVKQDLATEGMLVEDWGGKVPVVEISATKNKNIDDLLEMILLVAELEELKEDISLPAQGVIIESNLDKRKGHIATALVQKGILRVGDWVVARTVIGKIKMMENFMIKPVSQAVPSQPVRIIGWFSAPAIGIKFESALSKQDAEAIAYKNTDFTPLFQFFRIKNQPDESSKKYLKIIFKSDVSSSLEAIESTLTAIKSEEVACKVVSYDIGNIGENDINMAIGSGSHIIGFRVGIDVSAKKLAEKENVKVAIFDVIYELIEYIRKEMENLLEPEVRRNLLGKVKILAVFKNEGRHQIIGGKVISGKVVRGAIVDVLRNNVKLIGGKITQLQHNKEEASEVKEGLECGMKFEKIDQSEWEIKEGDALEVYQEEKIARNL